MILTLQFKSHLILTTHSYKTLQNLSINTHFLLHFPGERGEHKKGREEAIAPHFLSPSFPFSQPSPAFPLTLSLSRNKQLPHSPLSPSSSLQHRLPLPASQPPPPNPPASPPSPSLPTAATKHSNRRAAPSLSASAQHRHRLPFFSFPHRNPLLLPRLPLTTPLSFSPSQINTPSLSLKTRSPTLTQQTPPQSPPFPISPNKRHRHRHPFPSHPATATDRSSLSLPKKKTQQLPPPPSPSLPRFLPEKDGTASLSRLLAQPSPPSPIPSQHHHLAPAASATPFSISNKQPQPPLSISPPKLLRLPLSPHPFTPQDPHLTLSFSLSKHSSSLTPLFLPKNSPSRLPLPSRASSSAKHHRHRLLLPLSHRKPLPSLSPSILL